VISDGKWTNAYRTTMKATAMKDKGIQIFMAPIADHTTSKLKVLRGWASSPWETNYERIPGLDTLINNEPEFAQRLLVKFCPRAFSPSQQEEQEDQQGYLLVHEEGYPSASCGVGTFLQYVSSTDACMDAVKDRGMLAFSYTEGNHNGPACYANTFEVTADIWDQAMNERTNMSCSNGKWLHNFHTSTYILNPSMFGTIFEDTD